jgi:RNA polymerase sigma factor (TIGR02999 family)
VNEAVEQMYWALLGLARSQMRRERPDHTLSPTALVNEAYLKIEASFPDVSGSRRKLMAIAARLMRQVLVDHARRRNRDKRGGGVALDTYTDSLPAPAGASRVDLLDLEHKLLQLERMNAGHARIVECRFYGGMNIDETAEALGLSVSTVNRGWRLARAWLQSELGGHLPGNSP